MANLAFLKRSHLDFHCFEGKILAPFFSSSDHRNTSSYSPDLTGLRRVGQQTVSIQGACLPCDHAHRAAFSSVAHTRLTRIQGLKYVG